MNWLRHAGNIKLILIIIGSVLIISFLLYSQNLVEKLRRDNRGIVTLYAELIAKSTMIDSDENLEFIFENIIKKIHFPIVQTNMDGVPLSWRNLPKDIQSDTQVSNLVEIMDKHNKPISLIYTDITMNEKHFFGYLHFGDSNLIQRLIWLPYFEIGAISLFILIGFIGFSSIRHHEKQHIWIGMARETAHQLGTPVSALMGWVEWLQENPEKSHMAVNEMKTDLSRLNQISDRFSKMGSIPQMENVDILELLNDVLNYLKNRIPSKGKNLNLEYESNTPVFIRGNKILLSWAFENVIKNGIDAISQNDGEVYVRMQAEGNKTKIQIVDNGKGIEKKDRRNIFRPGFSTKKRGWGLGLSLTKRIITEIHGGKIYIKDSTPNDGTTFEIELSN